MASTEPASSHEQKPLEEKVADLKLGEDAGTVSDATNVSAKNADGGLNETLKEASEDTKTVEASKEASEDIKPSDKPEFAESREVNIAEKEAQDSPDKDAYAVPAVDHRTVETSGGKTEVEVPTAVVHEDAGATENAPQQGKGIIHSITRSVKSVFTGIGGGNKGTKDSDAKDDSPTEQTVSH